MSTNDLWADVVQLHQHTKALIILAEEHDLTRWKTFLQPMLEQRSALDHICRAKAVELKLVEPPDENYVDGSLNKAIGHLYRAFFDTADWCAILLREEILGAVGPYSNECLNSVTPEYYRNIRPSLEKICNDIAGIRNDKDISGPRLLERVINYKQIIDDLWRDHQTLMRAIPALEDASKKENCTKGKQGVFAVGCVIFGAILAWLIALIT